MRGVAESIFKVHPIAYFIRRKLCCQLVDIFYRIADVQRRIDKISQSILATANRKPFEDEYSLPKSLARSFGFNVIASKCSQIFALWLGISRFNVVSCRLVFNICKYGFKIPQKLPNKVQNGTKMMLKFAKIDNKMKAF